PVEADRHVARPPEQRFVQDPIELVDGSRNVAQHAVRLLELLDQLPLALQERVRDAALEIPQRRERLVVGYARARRRGRRHELPVSDDPEPRLIELAPDLPGRDVEIGERAQTAPLLEEQRADGVREAAVLEPQADVLEARRQVLAERHIALPLGLEAADAALRLRGLVNPRTQSSELGAEPPIGVRLALDEPLQIPRQLAQRRRRSLVELDAQRRELPADPRELELVDGDLELQHVDPDRQRACIELRLDQRRVAP